MTRSHLILLLILLIGAVVSGVLGQYVPSMGIDAVTFDMLGDALRAPPTELVASAVEAQMEFRATDRCAVVLDELDRRCPDGAIMLITGSSAKFWSSCEPAGCARARVNGALDSGDTVSNPCLFHSGVGGKPKQLCGARS